MAEKKYERDVKDLLQWVSDAHLVHGQWRKDAWTAHRFYDGDQWDADLREEMVNRFSITPLTLNRIFPLINLIFGAHSLNKQDMVALGRTQKDSDSSQMVTESLKFVMDQNDGDALVDTSFLNSIVGGFGCLYVGTRRDPRRERVGVFPRNWESVVWDPFGDVWMTPEQCRFVFYQRFMDQDDLISLFPEKEKEIVDQSQQLADKIERDTAHSYTDYAADIEDLKRGNMNVGGGWVDKTRSRVRPVEMWYTCFQKAIFAVFPDGSAYEISEKMDPREQYQLIQAAPELVKTTVRRMRCAVLFGNIKLKDDWSPHNHDLFPFIPFVGYVDRFGFPFGAALQVIEQNKEVNMRRSMALSLLKSRRVKAEEGAVSDPQRLYDEVNKQDGLILTRPGKIQAVEIQEMANLAPAHMELLRHAEGEIQQISGPNVENYGYQSNATSGIAIERRQAQGNLTTASLFANRDRSLKKLGEQIHCMIQQHWQGERVLRITDRLTGAQKFVELNKRIMGPDGGVVEVKNAINQGKYDIIMTTRQQTDTAREQQLIMVNEAIKKAPPEALPALIMMAFEIADLPNKEVLLSRLRKALGMPDDSDVPAEELKAREQAAQQQAAQQQAVVAEMEAKMAQLNLENQQLLNEKIGAEIKKIMNDIVVDSKKAGATEGSALMRAMKDGMDIQERVEGMKNDAERAIRGEQPDGKKGVSGGGEGSKPSGSNNKPVPSK